MIFLITKQVLCFENLSCPKVGPSGGTARTSSRNVHMEAGPGVSQVLSKRQESFRNLSEHFDVTIPPPRHHDLREDLALLQGPDLSPATTDQIPALTAIQVLITVAQLSYIVTIVCTLARTW